MIDSLKEGMVGYDSVRLGILGSSVAVGVGVG